jgi:long-chain acyl-CoA synthetase
MLKTIEQDRITIEMAVAPIAMAIAAHPDLESYDLSSLRYMIWGATPFAPSVAEAVTRRTGVRWVTAYGASELPVIACNPLDEPRLDTVGPAVPGVEIRVVSVDTGEVLSPRQRGEIQVRSDSMMAGYLPERASIDAFSNGWYRTGDIGTLDADGYLTITDRLKEMIKVRGFQVAPAEIESVLHQHPSVADCAAFGVPDEADGESIVVAVEASGKVDAAELIEFVGSRLASYKQPRVIQFVTKIPRIASGKVLRRVLKDGYGSSTEDSA